MSVRIEYDAKRLEGAMTNVDSEERIQASLRANDLHAAATLIVESYGPEVLGFLVTLLSSQHDASEVFSQSCEDLWRGLAQFEGRSSVRTWFYALARHAAARYHRSAHQRKDNRAALSDAGDVVERVRSATLPHLRTTVKDGISALRESLEEDDQALLVLRVDREMSWEDIAGVLGPPGQSREELARFAARLRKRFQVVKDELRERARAAGLLPEAES